MPTKTNETQRTVELTARITRPGSRETHLVTTRLALDLEQGHPPANQELIHRWCLEWLAKLD